MCDTIKFILRAKNLLIKTKNLKKNLLYQVRKSKEILSNLINYMIKIMYILVVKTI